MESAACRDIGLTDEAHEEQTPQEAVLLKRALEERALEEQAFAEYALAERALKERRLNPRTASERVPMERARGLAENILNLCDPWRARFVELIARYVGADTEGGPVALEELAGWLVDEDLHERIGLMLRSWTASR